MNKLYHASGVILDAITGKVLAGTAPGRGKSGGGGGLVPPTKHMLHIAGDHIYGMSGAKRAKEDAGPGVGLLNVYSLDGKKLGEATLRNAPVEGEKKEQIRRETGQPA